MTTFAQSLVAAGPASGDPALDLFGRLVGSWRVRNRFRASPQDAWLESERRWVFSWILDGRAIQDVLVGSDRGADSVAGGTTVRCPDPLVGGWRVEWFGVRFGNYVSLSAKEHGIDGIRQDGIERGLGGDVPVRWNFSGITATSFSWDGWSSPDGGTTWWLEQHMDCQREAP